MPGMKYRDSDFIGLKCSLDIGILRSFPGELDMQLRLRISGLGAQHTTVSFGDLSLICGRLKQVSPLSNIK